TSIAGSSRSQSGLIARSSSKPHSWGSLPMAKPKFQQMSGENSNSQPLLKPIHGLLE
ncbi:hypothetical protein GX51_08212, partial [Blastomyces parvus]